MERARKASFGFSVSVEGALPGSVPHQRPASQIRGQPPSWLPAQSQELAQSCPGGSRGSCHGVPPPPESVFSLRGIWSWSTLFFHSSYQVEWMKHVVEREKGVISVPEGGILARFLSQTCSSIRAESSLLLRDPRRRGGGCQGSVRLGMLVTAHCGADGMGRRR